MYDVLKNLKECIQTCFDDAGDCRYSFFVSLGIPPAACSSIAVWADSSQRSRSDNPECCTNVYDTDIKITLTHCCLKTDLETEFNPVTADTDSQCFLNDICRLRECLSCEGCTIPSLGCGLIVERVEFDQETQGNCYSATITVSFTEDCCGTTE